MIVLRLMGGLGNQLFQYAAGRRLALKHGADLVLDDRFFARAAKGVTPRAPELQHFTVRARAPTVAEGRRLRWFSEPRLDRVNEFVRLPGRMRFARERLGRFNAEVLALPDDSYLVGYWQSERYFEDSARVIREELAFHEPMSATDREVAGEMAACNAVSLHVRRGDYATSKASNAMHGLVGADYYRDAVRLIAEAAGDPVLFLFSDDPDWVVANLALDFPCRIVRHNDSATAFQDLRLMTLCRHHVIANSSFSWWGAWLCPHPGKIVIRPRRWFAGMSYDDAAVCPAEWRAL